MTLSNPCNSDDSHGNDSDFPEMQGYNQNKRFDPRKIAGRMAQLLECFYTAEKKPIILVKDNGYIDLHDLDSLDAKHIISGEYSKITRRTMTKTDFENIRTYLTDIAFQNERIETFCRVCRRDDTIFIDLCDSGHNIVKITADGWDVIRNEEIFFTRTGRMRPLPIPERDGSFDGIRQIINTANEDNFVMLVGFIVSIFNTRGNMPMLLVSGEQGTGKSSAMRYIKRIVDPNVIELQGMPASKEEPFFMLRQHWLVGYDNVSNITPMMSDSLCRLTSGVSTVKKKLYTDGDEYSVSLKRPVMLNGIGLSMFRGDAASRCMMVELSPIEKADRKTEEELDEIFRIEHPKIFGAICNAISAALREKDYRPECESRLADVERFVKQAEHGGGFPWEEGTFSTVFGKKSNDMQMDILANDVVAKAMMQMLEDGIFDNGKVYVRDIVVRINTEYRKEYGDRYVSTQIDRIAPLLREHNVSVRKSRNSNGVEVKVEKIV